MKDSLLLDTHVWIWLVSGSKELNKSARKHLENAVQENNIFIAAISLWEISMLDAKKRIILEMPCLEWIQNGLEYTHTQVLSLTPKIAVESCNLPGSFHEDPADRLIVATARVENLTIFTRDERILKYGNKKYISTFSV